MKGESTTLSEATSSEEDDAVPQRSSSRTQNTKIRLDCASMSDRIFQIQYYSEGIYKQ